MSGRDRGSAQALRAGLAALSPNVGEIARAAGLRRQTLYSFLSGRRNAPPAVHIVVANLLRERSELLLLAASDLETSTHTGTHS